MDVQRVSESFDNFGFRIPLVLCTFPKFMDDKNSAILENKNKNYIQQPGFCIFFLT